MKVAFSESLNWDKQTGNVKSFRCDIILQHYLCIQRLGIKKGLLHVYLRNGDIKDSAIKVSKMDGMFSSSVHVGNSDIVGDYVFGDSEQLVDTILNIKHMENVARVLWSEEVYSVPVNTENVLSSLRRM